MLDRQARQSEIHRLRQHRMRDVLGRERLHMDLARQQVAIHRGQRERNEARSQRRDRRQAEDRERAGADRRSALADVLQAQQQPLDFGVEQDALGVGLMRGPFLENRG